MGSCTFVTMFAFDQVGNIFQALLLLPLRVLGNLFRACVAAVAEVGTPWQTTDGGAPCQIKYFVKFHNEKLYMHETSTHLRL